MIFFYLEAMIFSLFGLCLGFLLCDALKCGDIVVAGILGLLAVLTARFEFRWAQQAEKSAYNKGFEDGKRETKEELWFTTVIFRKYDMACTFILNLVEAQEDLVKYVEAIISAIVPCINKDFLLSVEAQSRAFFTRYSDANYWENSNARKMIVRITNLARVIRMDNIILRVRESFEHMQQIRNIGWKGVHAYRNIAIYGCVERFITLRYQDVYDWENFLSLEHICRWNRICLKLVERFAETHSSAVMGSYFKKMMATKNWISLNPHNLRLNVKWHVTEAFGNLVSNLLAANTFAAFKKEKGTLLNRKLVLSGKMSFAPYIVEQRSSVIPLLFAVVCIVAFCYLYNAEENQIPFVM